MNKKKQSILCDIIDFNWSIKTSQIREIIYVKKSDDSWLITSMT